MISTLKFATRAKTIKTHYKLNIENSPETLQTVIERLRTELDDAKNQIQRFKTGEMYLGEDAFEIGIRSQPPKLTVLGQDLKKFSTFKPPDFSWKGKQHGQQTLSDRPSALTPEAANREK